MGPRIPFEATRLFRETRDDTAKVLVHEGGSRSSKTYSVLQFFIELLHTPAYAGLVLDVVRKTMPALRASAMKDFFDILMSWGQYRREWHNKSDNIYRVEPLNTEIAFYGMDQAQKARGRARDIIFCNEANELVKEDYLQIRLRTRRKMIFDYNPSDQFHWIYDDVLPRKDCNVIRSTYLDNPFLPEELVREIEALEHEDPAAWNVFGLGNRGTNEAAVYRRWELCDEMPTETEGECYGLDLGFVNATALLDVRWVDHQEGPRLYWDELLYERRLTTPALIERLDEMGIEKRKRLVVDPGAGGLETIEQLRRAGYNAIEARKGPGSVETGIKAVLSYFLYITKRSANLQKEIRGYRRKTDKDGNILEDPVKFNDHALDAGRYATHTVFGKRGRSWMVA